MSGIKEPSLPKMLPRYTKDFVTGFLDRKQIFREAVEQFGSPLYLVDEAALRNQARVFRGAMEKHLPDIQCYFAMKSNNLPYVSGVLLDEGFGLDVSSGMELSAALSLGAEKILFSGPGKTVKELELAIEHSGQVTILMDSEGEFGRLNDLAQKYEKTINVGIRLNCNPEGLWRKFGVALEQLPSLYEKIKASSHVNFKGLQFHSSWNMEPDRQTSFIKLLGKALEKMPESFLEELAFIDIGGGYWPSQGEWLVSDDPLQHYHIPAAPIEDFARELSKEIRQSIFPLKACRICFEPGRWISHDAMHILMQVTDKKADDLVITDAGTNIIGWERFETDYFPVINLTHPGKKEFACHILGALCTPHDVWGYACFGEKILEGDILMIPTQGAYTYSLRQQFIKPLPQVVILDGEHIREWRE